MDMPLVVQAMMEMIWDSISESLRNGVSKEENLGKLF